MSNRVEMRLLDLKAEQEMGKYKLCPRCGKDTMNPELHRNTLSRVADIYVCDACGTAEAELAVMKSPLMPRDWACMQVQNPYRAESIAEYMETIEEQIPTLMQLYSDWLKADKPEDFREYRYMAQLKCPGVTELWTKPFQVEYKAKDGSRALVRFREKDGELQYTIDTFKR